MDDRIIIESLDKRNVNMNMNKEEIVHQQPIVKNENKSTLEGVFNNIGEGKGVLIKANGEKWEGNFYGYEQIIK